MDENVKSCAWTMCLLYLIPNQAKCEIWTILWRFPLKLEFQTISTPNFQLSKIVMSLSHVPSRIAIGIP